MYSRASRVRRFHASSLWGTSVVATLVKLATHLKTARVKPAIFTLTFWYGIFYVDTNSPGKSYKSRGKDLQEMG